MTRTNDVLTALPAPPAPHRFQALFLDVDGTLCPIASRPAEVAIDAGLRALLARLLDRLDGAVALVSGRPLHWLLTETAGLPLTLVGTHGLELRDSTGRVTTAPPRPGLAPAIAAARHFAAVHLGVLVETKPLGVAIHYRLAAESGAAVAAFAEALARRHDLPIQYGNMVVELKGGAADKGEALGALLATPPFAGRVPVYVGDDLTDEVAFAAARAGGGFGILVGAPRDSAALYGLADTGAVHDWLETLA